MCVKTRSSPYFLDSFALQFVEDPQVIQLHGDRMGVGREHVQVDIRSLADASRQDAAEQLGMKFSQPSHPPDRPQPHFQQSLMVGLLTFVQTGERLNLLANFRVGGQIGWLDPALVDSFGSLFLGRVVLARLPASTSNVPLPKQFGGEVYWDSS